MKIVKLLTLCLLVFLSGCTSKTADTKSFPTPTNTNENKTPQAINTLTSTVQPVAQLQTPTPASTTKINTDITSDWKMYQNKNLKFALKMPPYISIDKEFNDAQNRLVMFKSQKENFEVRLTAGKNTTLNQYYYLDFSSSSKSTLGGKEALVFESKKGYCDGPSCTAPFVTYSTKIGDDFYNLVFSGDTTVNDTEKSILSTFRFTE